MGKKIWRYTLKPQEQRLWLSEGMEGWCKALEACVEDDARDNGSNKYIIFDRKGGVIAKDSVSPLPQEKKPAETF